MNYSKLTKAQLLNEINKLVNEKQQKQKSDFLEADCYQQLFNNTKDAILVHGFNTNGQPGQFIQANTAACNLLGYTPQELEKFSMEDILPKGFWGEITILYKELLEDKKIIYNTLLKTKDGFNIPVEIIARLFHSKERYIVLSIIQDQIEKRKTEFLLQKDTEKNKLLLRLFLNAPELSDKELFDYILDTAVYLTNSRIGFFHKVSDDQKTIILTTWNAEALKNCNAAYDTHYPIELAGNWADCVRTGRPIIYNNFSKSPHQKGLPKGHSPLNRFMSIPVKEEGKVRFIFGVGNKHEDYNEHDLIQVQLITSELIKILNKQKANKELKESRKKLKEAQKIARLGHWSLNLNNNKLEWSDEIFRIFGIDSNKFEASYELFQNAIHPDDREFVNNAYTESIKNKTQYDITHRIILPSGEIRYVQEQCQTTYNKKGKPLYSLGTIQDITKLKLAEEELKKYRNHLEDLVKERTAEVNRLSQAMEQSPASVVITNLNGDIIYVNKAFTEITGYSSEEAIGKNPRILKSGHHPESYYKELWNTILSGQTWKGELKNKKKNGRIFWESSSISPVLDENEKTISFVAVKFDITKRKKLEKDLIVAKEAAEAATNAKSEFLANMSHEIRTPMNAVLGFTELLQNLVKDKQQKSYLNALYSSSRNLLSIIDDILDFSKVEAGKLELHIDKTNARSFFSEIKHLFSLKAQKKGLEFIININDKIPQTIYIDDLRLRQVLINIINNAIKFTEKGYVKLKVTSSEIKIKELKEEYTDLIIKIEDTGIGISKKYKDRLFKSFTQENSDTTRKYGGSGLGLAIAYRLVKLMNGTISVQSVINKGSMFTLHIPKIKVSDTITNISTESEDNFISTHFDPATIIVIDDIKNNRKYLTEALFSLGFIVHACENGELALQTLNRVKPDLILTDIRMPIMDGFEFLKKLKKNKNYTNIPVIAISASVAINKKLKLKISEFDGFLSKPILLKELIKTLKQFLPYKESIYSEKEIKLSQKAIKELPLVIHKLETKFHSNWKNFEDRKPIEKVQSFGKDLLKLGKENDNIFITDYAESLIKSVDSFDIDTMLKVLQNYERLIQKLKNHHEKY